jgi:hypothetical protein
MVFLLNWFIVPTCKLRDRLDTTMLTYSTEGAETGTGDVTKD